MKKKICIFAKLFSTETTDRTGLIMRNKG